ncbi:nuclease-related domain-containing protein [Arthrobacter sp. 2MCAF14]|uniref:nuclease-related domain-containing protein n=1 Tax=Arthrobacter sp. 2MCAF14 TaxID=3232982 RepID=UPI003F8FE604
MIPDPFPTGTGLPPDPPEVPGKGPGTALSPELLTDRVPGQAVMAELLAVRERDAPRSRLGRVFGLDPLTADSRPWYTGAVGELAVARVLARLGPEWTVLHAVPVGAGTSDIDHVVIGPAGVYTVNTKNQSNRRIWVAGRTLMVAGTKQRYLPNAMHEAARAGKLLSAAAGLAVEVTGVLVFVEPKGITVRERPECITVLTDGQLLRWLNRRKPVHTPEQLARIVAVAALPETWHRRPAAPGDAVALQRGFAALRTEVVGARRRRAVWALAVATCFVIAVFKLPVIIAWVLPMLTHPGSH